MFCRPFLFTCLVFIFDKSCIGDVAGHDKDRIVGGVETTIEEHPYQLSLLFSNRPICGASLIRSDAALTAAHCVHGASTPELYAVRAGSTFSNKGGIVANVSSIHRHPKYKVGAYDYDYDVAVLILEDELALNKVIQIIELQLDGHIPRSTNGVVTGWGVICENGAPSTILRKVDIPRVNDYKCKRLYKKAGRKVTERMICFGCLCGGKDACQGDSGGPIVVDGKQVGIVSWGRGCARPCLPGVYTRLTNQEISDHINDVMEEFDY